MVLTKRDIAKSVKTLLVMLQSLRNQQVTITLRNDSIVQGTVVEIDGDMNIELARAIVKEDLFYCIQPNAIMPIAKINPNKKARLEPQEGEKRSTMSATLKTGEGQANNCGANKKDQEDDDADDKHVVRKDKDRDNDNDHDDDDDGDGDGEQGEEEDLSNTISHVYDRLIVKGSRVRHIDLPADCDMIASAKSEIERIRARRKQWTKRDIIVG